MLPQGSSTVVIDRVYQFDEPVHWHQLGVAGTRKKYLLENVAYTHTTSTLPPLKDVGSCGYGKVRLIGVVLRSQ